MFQIITENNVHTVFQPNVLKESFLPDSFSYYRNEAGLNTVRSLLLNVSVFFHFLPLIICLNLGGSFLQLSHNRVKHYSGHQFKFPS